MQSLGQMRIKALIDDMKDAVKDFPPLKEEEKKPKYPCLRCGGKGIIFTVEEGITKISVCPECLEARQRAWNLKQSGINEADYERYKLENFKPDSDEAQKMLNLAYRFLRDKKATGIGFLGRSGVGKTHICIGICQKLKDEHHYWQYRTEIQRIKQSMYHDARQYEELMNNAKNWKWLYIDDLFKDVWTNGNMTSMQDLQIMFDIINHRYIKRIPTIVSTEYDFQTLMKIDQAIASRLYEMLSPYVYEVKTLKNRRLQNFS